MTGGSHTNWYELLFWAGVAVLVYFVLEGIMRLVE